MAMFPGPEGSLTFRLNVAFATYRIIAGSSSRKTGFAVTCSGLTPFGWGIYRKPDFAGTIL
jgi:hypothetical protein